MNGTGGIMEYSKELTQVFEEMYKDRVWDGDWPDTIEEYLENKI